MLQSLTNLNDGFESSQQFLATMFREYPAPKVDRIVYNEESISGELCYPLSEYFGLEGSGSDVLSQCKSQLSEHAAFKTVRPQLKVPRVQINALKKHIGFNMSEIAAILKVGRPTVYEWLEAETPKLRENNRKRLDELYGVYEKWAETGLGRLDAYLRKTIIDNKSLFDLLSCKKINHSLVVEALSLLKQIIKKANKEKESSNNFIAKHGLEENTQKHKERMRKRHRNIG
jgi:hypothetical protein